MHLRRRERHGGGDRGNDTPQHQGHLRRDHQQSRMRGLRHREIRPHRPPQRPSPDSGQHFRDSNQLPALRVGSRHRDPFHYQIYGRPRHPGGRGHSGQRKLRLEGQCGEIPRTDHSRRLLPRARLRRRLRQEGLYHQGRVAANEGSRLHARPHELLPPEPRAGDPASQGGPPLRERDGRGPFPARRPARGVGALLRARGRPLLRTGPEISA